MKPVRFKAIPGKIIPINVIDRYKDMEFHLIDCGLISTQVVCEFVVTNLGQDLEDFKLVGRGYNDASEMYDNFGHDYAPIEFQVAGYKDNLVKAPRLISGVPVQGKLIFQDVDPVMSSITLLQLNGSAEGDDFSIKFQNIPVTQE